MEDVPPQVNDVLLVYFGLFQLINSNAGFSKKKKEKKKRREYAFGLVFFAKSLFT